MRNAAWPAYLVALAATLFAIFPLTDTDIWWHMACAREWVTTWTPVRIPVVNVHDFFQQVVAFVYTAGGAPLLVAFKAVLWGCVFALFLRKTFSPSLGTARTWPVMAVSVFLLFIFRFQFEIRPVVFSLLFLGVYWNVLPWLVCCWYDGVSVKRLLTVSVVLAILTLQWIWCNVQGLYILGPLFAGLCVAAAVAENFKKKGGRFSPARDVPAIFFVAVLFLTPFFHRDGLDLFLYPFGLLDRLLGISPSAVIFASEIAENRSPVTLLMAGENLLPSIMMIVVALIALAFAVERAVQGFWRENLVTCGCLAIMACLTLVAERNFVLLLPVAMACVLPKVHCVPLAKKSVWLSLLLVFAIFGFWAKSLTAYEATMVSAQRVPVMAAQWMKAHPHAGRLFNDDRAGGYLAFVNPMDSTYIDGRFILKTAVFFERYLRYSEQPNEFIRDAEALDIDRAVLPRRYYARWGALIEALENAPMWSAEYVDSNYVVFDKKKLQDAYSTAP